MDTVSIQFTTPNPDQFGIMIALVMDVMTLLIAENIESHADGRAARLVELRQRLIRNVLNWDIVVHGGQVDLSDEAIGTDLARRFVENCFDRLRVLDAGV